MTSTGLSGWMGTVDTDPTANHRTAKPSPSGSTLGGITPITYQVKHARRPFTKSKFVGEGREDSTCGRSHEPSQGHVIRPQASGLDLL